MADSVGKGIALGERFKYDTTSGTKMLNDALQYKVASDRKKEADAVSSLDFKIDYKNLLPAYGKRIAEIATEPLNKYAQYKKEDPRTAMNRVQADFYEAQQKIGRLTRDNEAAKNYVSQKAGFAVNPDLVNALISTDSDFEAISKFNNGDFLNIGKDGEFAFRPIEVMNPSAHVKYDNEHDYDKRFGGTKPIGIAGKTQIEQIEEVKPGAIARNAVALTTNPQFRDNVLLSRPDLIGLPEKEQYGAIYNEAFKISTQLARAPKSEWKIVDLPNPTGSGSDKDKREKPILVVDSPQSIMIQSDEMEDVPNYDEKGVEIGTKKQFKVKPTQSFMALSTAIPNVPAMTIPLDERVIDAKTNTYLKGDQLSQNVTFKPDMVYTEFIKKTGKWEKYVLGTATTNVEVPISGGDKITTQKILTYKMPYDKVKSTIEGKYDMTEFDKKFGSLPPPKKAGGTKQPEAPKPTQTQPTAQSNDYIDSILDFENKKGYSNYGFTSYSGSLNKAQAKDKFKKEYEPIVRDLPAPLQATAGDFAFNSEDPRASLMVAAGVITPSEKGSLYSNGKLDKAKVENLWKQKDGLNTIKKLYNKNPSAFLDRFDNERLRSYKNTNGADVKFGEWEERVAVSRSAANKLLNTTPKPTKGKLY